MANANIPILDRRVTAQTTSAPEVQSGFENLAQAQNNLSVIGNNVAQNTNNQIASTLGYEQGKTPHGDLMPPITEFDQHFADSYHQQANATLSLQGQKLLEDAQIEMSKPARLTPDLIDKTHSELELGLAKISEMAPNAIKPQLEAQFNSQILHQTTQYKEKMISEQRQDQRDNLINAMDLNVRNIQQLASSGDLKGTESAINSSVEMANNSHANRFLTPEEARVYKETAVQAGISGRFIGLATQAYNSGKYESFERDFADKKLPEMSGMTNEQFVAAGSAFQKQIQFLDSLKSQDENLKYQQMLNQIALDPGSITGSQWKTFSESVSPLKAEQIKFHYIQALNKHQSDVNSMDGLIANFSNPEVIAKSTPKMIDAAYNKQVDYVVQNSHRTTVPFRSPVPVSRDEAEVQVAASAGGVVPVFVKSLQNKLHSANPAFIESAAQQIHMLQQMQAGHALQGLSDQDHTLYTTYESLRNSRDPVTAAADATQIVFNQDPDVQQANKQKWSNFVTTNTSGGIPSAKFALTSFDMHESDFINDGMAQVYGTDILRKYSSIYQMANGDVNVAKKVTQSYINENYGETGVNGGSHTTLHPIEKVLGFQDKSGVPYIQQDVVNQLNEKLLPVKEMYAKNKTDEYWETLPVSNEKHGIFSKEYDPIKIKRHMKTAQGEKVDTFNLVLLGNDFDWDVAVQTDSGMRNLFQLAPALGVINYRPNVKAIRASYDKNHQLN